MLVINSPSMFKKLRNFFKIVPIKAVLICQDRYDQLKRDFGDLEVL